LIKLYHGSNLIIEKPQLVVPQRKLDFGAGFYTTLNSGQAEQFAEKVSNREESVGAFVSVFSVGELDALRNRFSICVFDEPNEDWLDFVYENRMGIYEGEDFDIVFGPVANDTVFRTFIAYEAGIYTKEETIAHLKVHELFNQMVFKSESAIASLDYLESFEVTK
jgi:hypothetical protein